MSFSTQMANSNLNVVSIDLPAVRNQINDKIVAVDAAIAGIPAFNQAVITEKAQFMGSASNPVQGSMKTERVQLQSDGALKNLKVQLESYRNMLQLAQGDTFTTDTYTAQLMAAVLNQDVTPTLVDVKIRMAFDVA